LFAKLAIVRRLNLLKYGSSSSAAAPSCSCLARLSSVACADYGKADAAKYSGYIRILREHAAPLKETELAHSPS